MEISTSITQVEGTANFPEVSVPSGGSSNTEYGGSAWVGIDGDTCSTSILQTGKDAYYAAIMHVLTRSQASIGSFREVKLNMPRGMNGCQSTPTTLILLSTLAIQST